LLKTWEENAGQKRVAVEAAKRTPAQLNPTAAADLQR
jgi:hypothetical protein